VHAYGIREVEKLLRLPRSTIRSLVKAGFVSPSRGPRNAWRFSFQDLIVLRAAQSLASANLPARRITRSLKELRRRLPDSMPLSGLKISAEAGRILVTEGARRWQADSGQYLLAFEALARDGTLHIVQRPPTEGRSMLARALELEESDADAAIAAYQRAIDLEPGLVDAHLNRGRLLHETGRLRQAERAYCEGMKACGESALLFYNLGVLHTPDLADCHYNLALLYEALSRPRDAIRHMSHYRRLSAAKK
jgi:tetratricopeptide (TPR) repeat protein